MAKGAGGFSEPVYFPGDDLPHRRRLRNDNGLRFRRRLRSFAHAYAEGRLSLADINPSVQAWIGHARHADTLGLRQSIFNAVSFTRGTDR